MRFIDEAIIEITSGNGGKGCISFIRTKNQPRGGPDGSNGGQGGHIILRASRELNTLADHKYLRFFQGNPGKNGQSSNKTGAKGKNKLIKVPLGTTIYDNVTNELLSDLTKDGQEFIAAYGGMGGKGNRHFVSSIYRIPRSAQPGKLGERRTLRLELKVLANVGLIGLPNAGKSSFIRSITNAKPKVANYPFTTLSPHLGVIERKSSYPIIIADIPGLIAGAHHGAGLGIKFLKHIERTQLFIYLLDLNNKNPIKDLQTILTEIKAYNTTLLNKTSLIVANKIDLPYTKQKIKHLIKNIKPYGLKFSSISAINNQGINELITIIFAHCKQN